MDRFRAKVRAFSLRLFHRGRAQNDFEAELESHIALHTDHGVRAGLTPEDARRQALIRLGGAEQTSQSIRDRRTLPWLEALVRDLRYSMRSLAKYPIVTAIAILSIGLGIGANATIFSMVSRFLLRPAPVGDPATLLALSTVHKGDRCCNHFPYPVFQDVRNQARSFSDVAAYYELIPASISGNGDPERVWGQGATTNFFDVIQLPMVLGRGFSASEDTAPVIVLGEGLWRRRFNADASILGKSILLSGRNFTVIGIAPGKFRSIDQILDTQFWVPLGVTAQLVPKLPAKDSREFHWLSVVGRMRPGVSQSQADAELATLADRYARLFPATDKDDSFHVQPAGTLPPNFKGTVILFLAALAVIVVLVLAIAGANVANLLFVQAAARQREMAVRLALGATRAGLRRRVLLESVLIGLGGGVLGVVLALWATRGLSALRMPAPVPLDLALGIDGRVLAATFALSVCSGILLGLAPAWAASRPQLTNALKGEDALARPGRRWTLRNLLVVGQIAMAVVLLTTTVLFLRNLSSAASIDIGFKPKGLLVLSVDPRVHGYSAPKTAAFLAQARMRIAALPGVDSAVATDVPLLSGGNRSDGFTVEGAAAKDNAMTFADLYMVTSGYFNTLGIPLLTGHDFQSDGDSGPRTAVINRAFADRLFAGVNPIGQHVKGGGLVYEVIGVVENVKSRTLGEEARPLLYRSLNQSMDKDPSVMGYTLIVHTPGSAASLIEPVQRQVHALDPAMAIYNVETMDEHVRTAYVLPRLAAMLFGIFGGIGVLLAAIGLYGVMSYSVSRRTREMGIRMALGAESGTLERMVLRQGLLLSLIAVALGWPAAWMVAKLATSFLYGIHPHDALTFVVVPPFLVMIALLACWIPARRAASIDPMQALRTE
ncbi:MAG TPA: ABC transporter permease [Terracidiphilus sp.]|jgi:predicted permease|nr:ABC transporter permease [Terracidiphilus sp.]